MNVSTVAGVEILGLSRWQAAVGMETRLLLLIVRKSIKDYGTKSRFVGDIKPKDKKLLEDVTTSGGSERNAIEIVRETEPM